jgi:hypothetical protein
MSELFKYFIITNEWAVDIPDNLNPDSVSFWLNSIFMAHRMSYAGWLGHYTDSPLTKS